MDASSRGSTVIKEMCKKFENSTSETPKDSRRDGSFKVKSNIENLTQKPITPYKNQKQGCSPTSSHGNKLKLYQNKPSPTKTTVSEYDSFIRRPRNIENESKSTRLAEGKKSYVPQRVPYGKSALPRSSVADRLKLFESNSPENNAQNDKADVVSRRDLRDLSTPPLRNNDFDTHHATFAVTKMANSTPLSNPIVTRQPTSSPKYYSRPIPPKKPPRTFAHDRYVESKMKTDEVNSRKYYELYNSVNKNEINHVFVDLTSVNFPSKKEYGTLKRSFSEEHIYAEPYEGKNSPEKNLSSPIYEQPIALKKHQRSSTINNKDLHYMSTPIVGVNSTTKIREGNFSPSTPSPNRKASTTSNIREIVNQSFNELWKKLYTKGVDDGIDQADISDSGSEVSMKDVQDRIIYVKSLKNMVIGTAISDKHHEKGKLFNSLLVSCLTPARKESPPKPRIIYKYPEQEDTVYEETMIPQICFPDSNTIKATTSYKSETFFFVVKDGTGSQTFGFCLRLLGSPQCNSKTAFLTLPAVVCLLTTRNAVGLYMKILLEIEKHLFLSQREFQDYIMRLYNTEVPIPGRVFWLPDRSEPNKISRIQILRPTDNRIINTEVTQLLQHLEVDLLLKVIASLLLERRILLVANSSSTLFKCTTAILSLLYPLGWRRNVIPSLPDCLLSQACTTLPFLFGVSSHRVHKIMDIQTEKMLIVDLDQGQIMREVGDEHTILPNRSLKAVKAALSLAKNMTDPTEMLRDVMISEAFLRMFVETIGHCDKFITVVGQGNLVFQKEAFCKHPSSKSVQMFLTWFCETEMFEAFVNERTQLKRTASIRKQPVLSIPESLFDRRLEEYLKCRGSSGVKENVRELGKKVKIFGERLKGLKSF